MTTGRNLNGVGLSSFAGNAQPPLNCRIGKSYVVGYRSRKFHLPDWLRAHLGTDSFELAVISGSLAAFLMSWDMQLAHIWANRMGVPFMNTLGES